GRARGRQVGLLGLSLGTVLALWGFATLGWQLISGQVWPPLAPLLPVDTPLGAFAAFAAGSAALLLASFLAAIPIYVGTKRLAS
ncbi:MAG: hypothetical protein AAFQ50_09870, partial [Pseudomonadota bacterium]